MEHSNHTYHEFDPTGGKRLSTGRVLRGRFEIGPCLATTRLHTIYYGYDREWRQAIVIKQLVLIERPGGLPRMSALRAFVAESMLLQSIDHPQVPTLYALLRENGDYYMVMQYMAGIPLDQLMEHGTLTCELALRICQSLCTVIEALHRRSIIHGDLKPNNLLVLPGGRVQVVDFGLARRAGQPAAIGEVMGTPPYAPPEQWAGALLDERSDIYALGQLLSELFTVVHCPELHQAVLPALAAEPKQRFATVAELRLALATASARNLAAPEWMPLELDLWQVAGLLMVFVLIAIFCLR